MSLEVANLESLSLLPSITVSLAFYLAFYRLLSLSLCLSCLPLSRCLSNSLSSLTLSHTQLERARTHTHEHTHIHTPRCCIHRSGLTRDTHTHKQTHTHTHQGVAYTGLALGVLGGPFIGGLLFEKLGRRSTFHLAAAVVFATALAQILL